MGLISEETIQRVIEASDIVDVIGGYFPLKRAGGTFRALCPFHREKTPSFHVNPARQTFHCFGCNAGGGVVRFVMDYEHLEFPAAVKKLAHRAGIAVIEDESGRDDARRGQRQRLLAMHADAAEWFHQKLLKAPEADAARRYLKSRGINSDIAKSWKIGFAPDSWDELLLFLADRKFSREEIQQGGLASGGEDAQGKFYARFRNRIMFPIRNDNGEVIAFSGRVLDPEAKAAKYVNSPETPVFTKGRVLYGLDKTKRDLIEQGAAIVCEGQLDLITAFEAGVRNVIAPQGTAFTPEQARLLARFVSSVLLCFDSDAAGEKAATRSVPALLAHNLTVKIISLPSGEDPDSLIRNRGAEAFLAAVSNATEFFEFSSRAALARGTLANPADAAAFIKEAGGQIALIADKALREAAIGRLHTALVAAGTAVAPATILKLLNSPAEHRAQPDQDASAEPEVTLSQGLRILCILALQNAAVREWFRSLGLTAANYDPSGHILDTIASASYADDPSGLASFLGTLDAGTGRVVASLLRERTISEPLDKAQATWRGLLAERRKETIERLVSKLREPGLSPEERETTQKQILDLKIQLAEDMRPV